MPRTPSKVIAWLNEFIEFLNMELGERINRGYPHIHFGRKHQQQRSKISGSQH